MRHVCQSDGHSLCHLALAYLQQRVEIDPHRIGILGFSIGGQIASRAAAQLDQLKAIVA